MELLLLGIIDVGSLSCSNLHSNMELLLQCSYLDKCNNKRKFTFQYGATSTMERLLADAQKIRFTFQYGATSTNLDFHNIVYWHNLHSNMELLLLF